MDNWNNPLYANSFTPGFYSFTAIPMPAVTTASSVTHHVKKYTDFSIANILGIQDSNDAVTNSETETTEITAVHNDQSQGASVNQKSNLQSCQTVGANPVVTENAQLRTENEESFSFTEFDENEAIGRKSGTRVNCSLSTISEEDEEELERENAVICDSECCNASTEISSSECSVADMPGAAESDSDNFSKELRGLWRHELFQDGKVIPINAIQGASIDSERSNSSVPEDRPENASVGSPLVAIPGTSKELQGNLRSPQVSSEDVSNLEFFKVVTVELATEVLRDLNTVYSAKKLEPKAKTTRKSRGKAAKTFGWTKSKVRRNTKQSASKNQKECLREPTNRLRRDGIIEWEDFTLEPEWTEGA